MFVSKIYMSNDCRLKGCNVDKIEWQKGNLCRHFGINKIDKKVKDINFDIYL